MTTAAVHAATLQEMPGIVRAKAEAAVKERLRDPGSVEFSNVTTYGLTRADGPPTAVCGEFNAKNGFCGYGGREPFVWVAFDQNLHVNFDHGTVFLGREVYTRKMLIVCKFPVAE